MNKRRIIECIVIICAIFSIPMLLISIGIKEIDWGFYVMIVTLSIAVIGGLYLYFTKDDK